MNNNSSSDHTTSTTLGWKFVAIVAGISTIFFVFLYLAMSSEPDYMPNRPAKVLPAQDVNVPAASTPQVSSE